MNMHVAICNYMAEQERIGKDGYSNAYRAIKMVLGITDDQIKGKSRSYFITEARQAFCYILRETMHKGYREIGLEINRDHSSVIHSVNEFKNRLNQNVNNIQSKFSLIKQNISYCLKVGELNNSTHER